MFDRHAQDFTWNLTLRTWSIEELIYSEKIIVEVFFRYLAPEELHLGTKKVKTVDTANENLQRKIMFTRLVKASRKFIAVCSLALEVIFLKFCGAMPSIQYRIH